jgi:hypothetical protein
MRRRAQLRRGPRGRRGRRGRRGHSRADAAPARLAAAPSRLLATVALYTDPKLFSWAFTLYKMPHARSKAFVSLLHVHAAESGKRESESVAVT